MLQCACPRPACRILETIGRRGMHGESQTEEQKRRQLAMSGRTGCRPAALSSEHARDLKARLRWQRINSCWGKELGVVTCISHHSSQPIRRRNGRDTVKSAASGPIAAPAEARPAEGTLQRANRTSHSPLSFSSDDAAAVP